MGKIISVFNQKGGVAKTATINNLAFELHARGKKVLMVDADQQENLPISVGVIPKNCNRTIYDVLLDEIEDVNYKKDLSDVIVKTEYGVDLLPGSVEMAEMDEKLFALAKTDTILDQWLSSYEENSEIREQTEDANPGLKGEIDRFLKLSAGYKNVRDELIASLIDEGFLDDSAQEQQKKKDGRFIFKKILAGVKDNYDYILIDCPPALSAITKNILNASNSVIVPMTLEPFSASGLSHLITSVNTIRQQTNPRLKFSGLLYTMVDERLILSKDIKEQTDWYKQLLYIYKVQIPRSTDVNKAFAEMTPLIEYNKNNIARLAYSDFCDEFLEREG